MIEFLQTCPNLSSTNFINFSDIKEGTSQFVLSSDDVALQRPYITGAILKRYTINIDNFKSIAYTPNISLAVDENLEEFTEVQTILDWINECGDNRIFPNFGADCEIEEMYTTTDKPILISVETTTNQPVAVYRVTVQVDYIDNSRMIWKG